MFRRGASSKKKGLRYEYEVKKKLERQGFEVVRTAGSRGPFDLVAFKPGILLLLECTTKKDVPTDKIERLRTLAKSLKNAKVKVGLAIKGKGLILFDSG